MRKNTQAVLEAFKVGKSASDGTISTDGTNVYSYNMLIAQRDKRGNIQVIEYNKAPSHTTRLHVKGLEYYFPEAIRVCEFD
jgi:hypothetical protein